MIYDEEFERCRERAVNFLGIDHGKPSGRVRRVLLEDGYDSDTVERVIEYLCEIDYINDRRAAERICKRYRGRRTRSQRAMLYTLTKSGINNSIAKEVVDRLSPDEESSLVLLDAYYKDPHKVPKDKAMRLLARRGYSAFVARNALRKYLRLAEEGY